jgi:hypothetical protein
MPRFKAALVAAILVLTPLLAGCSLVNPPTTRVQLPLAGDPRVPVPQQNDQVMRVTLLNGKFDATQYSEQTGATQMIVIATDGPYLFEIDNLVDRRELPAYGGTVINFDTGKTGYYTMRAYRSTSDGTSSVADTATLRIAPVGL